MRLGELGLQGQTAWVWPGVHLVWWEAPPAVLLRRDGEVISQLSAREDAPSWMRTYFLHEDCVLLQVTEV